MDKTYDGTTNMLSSQLGYGNLAGVIQGDAITLTGVPVYSSANAGSRSILQGSVALAGTDAGNYNLSWSNGSGTINKAPLTVTVNADTKFVT